ncbi:MAG: DUF2007 domain-containing protein [Rhizobiaceae bacterium]
MQELVRTNDPVIISFLGALFRDHGIVHVVLDTNMSVLDGSLGVLPMRIMVDSEQGDLARNLVRDAGLECELRARDRA